MINNYYTKTEVNAELSLKASSINVNDLGVLVNTKASQSGLDALTVNLNGVVTSLNSNYNTLSTLLGTRASQTSVTAALATKQDLLGDSVTIRSLSLIGNSDVALLQHSEGFAM